jgi:hypothetical protein
MSDLNNDDRHEGLDEVVRRLQEQRPEATAFELDQLKMRTLARARTSGRKGFMRTRLVATVLSLGLLAAGTGGVIAKSGGGGGGGGGAQGHEYHFKKPKKDCSQEKNSDKCVQHSQNRNAHETQKVQDRCAKEGQPYGPGCREYDKREAQCEKDASHYGTPGSPEYNRELSFCQQRKGLSPDDCNQANPQNCPKHAAVETTDQAAADNAADPTDDTSYTDDASADDTSADTTGDSGGSTDSSGPPAPSGKPAKADKKH